jgi:hypothetical protein
MRLHHCFRHGSGSRPFHVGYQTVFHRCRRARVRALALVVPEAGLYVVGGQGGVERGAFFGSGMARSPVMLVVMLRSPGAGRSAAVVTLAVGVWCG